jgi:hypothetical protein
LRPAFRADLPVERAFRPTAFETRLAALIARLAPRFAREAPLDTSLFDRRTAFLRVMAAMHLS